MSDEEEDYMSEKFVEATTRQPAPSLLYRRSDQRQMELVKRKAQLDAKMREKNASAKNAEQEKREEGLSSAISSDNKGFEMLMKMGYKPGQGIGKSESGICEPITVELKSNRGGLGKEAGQKKKSKKPSNPLEKLEKLNTEDYRIRLAGRKAERLAEVDFTKSQRVCEQLDSRREISQPEEIWYWPAVKKSKEEDEEAQEEEDSESEDEDLEKLTVSQKLEILTKYLREKYFYCVWCGAGYVDSDDLRDNCPGSTRNDH